MRGSTTLRIALGCLLFVAGCTGEIDPQLATGEDLPHGAVATGGSAANAGGAVSGGVAALVIDVGPGDYGGSSSTGNGKPELCDGIDNDENGNIDDVDAGGDGVCDCLNIATVGQIGPHSNGGNIFTTWLNARSPLGAVALGDRTLTAETLLPFQVIVVLHAATIEIEGGGRIAAAHHAFSDAETSVFDAWLRGGGGVMTTTGYTGDEATEIVNVNKLLAKAGMGYSTSRFDLSGEVNAWSPHPVTAGVTKIRTDNGVEPAGAGASVAHGEGNSVALQVLQAGDGRVVVWGDEWITYDSEWADVEGQQVELFWLNILKWLSPPGECQVPIPPRVK